MEYQRHIVITGASSGIGAALACHYAAPGVRLGLLGRDETRLTEVAKKCEAKGAIVQPVLVEVTDAEAMQECLQMLDNAAPIDLLIANAGISAGTGGDGEPESQVRDIFRTNVDGVVNTVLPILDRMTTRRSGQIAIMSSLAGIRGLPSCPAYGASKAAIRHYGEGLRGYASHFGVKVNVICPGYIRTPMTAVNDFPMPFIMSAERAARIIARGLRKNRSRIAFPWPLYAVLLFASWLPLWLTDPIFAALPQKPSSRTERC